MPVYPNDMLSTTFLTGAIEKRPTRAAIKQRYIGATLLPWKEVPGRKLTWDVLFNENPLAGVYDQKGKAIPGSDLGYATTYANLLDIKSMRVLDPDLANSLREPGWPAIIRAAGDSIQVKSQQAREREEYSRLVAWCDDTIDAQAEYLAMQAISTGAIVWPPVDNAGAAFANPMPHWNSEMTLSFVFPMRNEFKQMASTLVGYDGRVNKDANGASQRYPWDNPAADIIQDLEIIAELFLKRTGLSLRGGKIYMSETLLSKIAFNTKFIQWVAGTNREQPGARQYVDIAEIKSIIQTRLGWTIELYDAQWTHATQAEGAEPVITRVNFMHEGTVVILPPNADLGNMGTTFLRRKDGTYKSGKYPWTWEDDQPPHHLQMGINLVAFPLFSYYDWFILKALS